MFGKAPGREKETEDGRRETTQKTKKVLKKARERGQKKKQAA